MGALEQGLRKGLTALELRRGTCRSEDAQPRCLKRVDDAKHERQLGTNQRKVDLFCAREIAERVDGIHGNIDKPSECGDAGVARRAVDRRRARTLRQLPHERMLATTTTDHQDSHSGRLARTLAWCHIGPLWSSRCPPLVSKVARPGHDHRHVVLVGRRYHLGIPHGAARLNHRTNASLGDDIEAVPEREERIRRRHRAMGLEIGGARPLHGEPR